MSGAGTAHGDAAPGLLGRWMATPLYLRILGALVLGGIVGVTLGPAAGTLATPAKLILRLLGAIAPPLVFLAIVRALIGAHLARGSAGRLIWLLALNTTMAILIGLAVANILAPGSHGSLTPSAAATPAKSAPTPLEQFLDNVPRSLLGPFGDDGKVIAVILIALVAGAALRPLRDHPLRDVKDLVEVAFQTVLRVLYWVIEIVPLGVFGIIASIVGAKGFADFVALGYFVLAVILALLLQATWYLARIRWRSWVRPTDALRGMRDALVMAFSTASSTATMPLTYSCLRERVGLREQSASLGALVGANFNNDGTALYEAMAALFIAQMLGMELTLTQQVLVVLTSMAASVGAAGIPEAGLVTMVMVFKAVGLPVEYIAILFTVDWFLDRCRTTINVMGDVNVSCLLDGRERPPTAALAATASAPATPPAAAPATGKT